MAFLLGSDHIQEHLLGCTFCTSTASEEAMKPFIAKAAGRPLAIISASYGLWLQKSLGRIVGLGLVPLLLDQVSIVPLLLASRARGGVYRATHGSRPPAVGIPWIWGDTRGGLTICFIFWVVANAVIAHYISIREVTFVAMADVTPALTDVSPDNNREISPPQQATDGRDAPPCSLLLAPRRRPFRPHSTCAGPAINPVQFFRA
jgi:hypothetical protein